MKKRTLSIVLATMLIIPTLVGCKDNKHTSTVEVIGEDELAPNEASTEASSEEVEQSDEEIEKFYSVDRL